MVRVRAAVPQHGGKMERIIWARRSPGQDAALTGRGCECTVAASLVPERDGTENPFCSNLGNANSTAIYIPYNNLPVASLLALRGRMASRNLSCRLVQLGVKPGLSLEPCFAQVRLRSARMTNARWDWHRFPHSAVDIVSAMDFCRLVLRHARQR